MATISAEAPRLPSKGRQSCPPSDAEHMLEAGMALSIETTPAHATRGFVKLADTAAVTANGYEIFGKRTRGWNRGRGPWRGFKGPEPPWS